MKPGHHGPDHAADGEDPIPGLGAGGIDFNKNNEFDGSGADAGYLRLTFIGTPLSSADAGGEAGGPFSYLNLDTGVGSQLIKNDGGGLIGLVNVGDGLPYGGAQLFSGEGEKNADGDTLFGLYLSNDGKGGIYLRSTEGKTEIYNADTGITLASPGADINGVAIKHLIEGSDFLVANSQDVTRDGTTHEITGIAYNQPRLRINDTDFFIYDLPTSNPGGSNKLWSNGGVLTIT